MNEGILKTIMPDISDKQIEGRKKLMIAREMASLKVKEKIPDDARALYLMIADTVTECAYVKMSDEVLSGCISYCQSLLQSARGAEWFWSNVE